MALLASWCYCETNLPPAGVTVLKCDDKRKRKELHLNALTTFDSTDVSNQGQGIQMMKG